MNRALRCDGFLDGLNGAWCRLFDLAYISGWVAGRFARGGRFYGGAK